jgi:hypothetical protein
MEMAREQRAGGHAAGEGAEGGPGGVGDAGGREAVVNG